MEKIKLIKPTDKSSCARERRERGGGGVSPKTGQNHSHGLRLCCRVSYGSSDNNFIIKTQGLIFMTSGGYISNANYETLTL